MHDFEPSDDQMPFDYDSIQVVHKVQFGNHCHKDNNKSKANIMFDEIADVKRNLRVLSDLYTLSKSCNSHVRYKLDTGAGGNLMPFDTWQQFFPGSTPEELKCSIDHSVILKAYNKSSICQLGTCEVLISHRGVSHKCFFYVVPSQYCPILGLSDLLALKLVNFNCPTTQSWSSSRTTTVDTVNCDNITPRPTRPLTKTDITENPKYKHLFQGVGKFKIKPVDITIWEGATPYQAPPR